MQMWLEVAGQSEGLVSKEIWIWSCFGASIIHKHSRSLWSGIENKKIFFFFRETLLQIFYAKHLLFAQKKSSNKSRSEDIKVFLKLIYCFALHSSLVYLTQSFLCKKSEAQVCNVFQVQCFQLFQCQGSESQIQSQPIPFQKPK